MKEVVVFLTVYGMVLMPLYANAEASRSARAVANAAAPPVSSVSLLEAAETAAASGVYRAQNLPALPPDGSGRTTTGGARSRSLISGVLAFAGAALWRWLPCREAR